MQYANQMGAQFVAVVGENEMKTQEVDLKDMATGKAIKAPLYNLERILRVEDKSQEFMRLWDEMTTPFNKPEESEFFINKLNDSIVMTQELSKNLQTAVEKLKKL